MTSPAPGIMISDEYPEMGIRGPLHWGRTPVRFHLHVDDVDALARRAEEVGAAILRVRVTKHTGSGSGSCGTHGGTSGCSATGDASCPTGGLTQRDSGLF